jgi:protein CWC15
MTTAHRPTWNPAQASKDQGGNRSIAPPNQYSSRDLPGHKVLKVRQPGQNTLDEIATRNLKDELLRKEEEARRKRNRNEDDDDEDNPPKKPKLLEIDFAADADDSDNDSSSDDDNQSESSSDSESDSSDDEDELQRELEKIRAERAAAQQKKVRIIQICYCLKSSRV